ncbi:MAG TPA: nucleoside monophosphate kinase [Candidatus Saccharimonadales bacterium]|nr:nucleoside monophosphate kinase [Candidatus Saccharimonadales bacterium]
MTTLVLFGRPASGKGTVGQRLADSGYQTCSTGQQMREWAAGPSDEQRALRETMAAGGYGTDELAVRIVREFILGLPPGSTGVLLDGFPRDLAQLDAWLAAPIDHGIAVLVDTPEAVCRDRVLGRMVCPACGWTDHAPATTCIRCGAVLSRRADDGDAEIFDRRMHDYDARVAPVIDAWERAGLPLIKLDGTRDVDAIARDLLAEVARLEAG